VPPHGIFIYAALGSQALIVRQLFYVKPADSKTQYSTIDKDRNFSTIERALVQTKEITSLEIRMSDGTRKGSAICR
jgi:hypothetical protein